MNELLTHGIGIQKMALFRDASTISRHAARLWDAVLIPLLFVAVVGGVQIQRKVVISPEGAIEVAPDAAQPKDTSSSLSYGVDVSWPMHHPHGQRDENPSDFSAHGLYSAYMDGCRRRQREQLQQLQYHDKDVLDDDDDDDDLCQMYESNRIEMHLLQPRTMENYTHVGYAKVKTPPILKQTIQNFWNANRGHEVEENWSPGNTYVNHWDVPTKMLDVGRQDVPLPLTNQERVKFVQQVQSVLEEWTKQSLVFTSLYGIRIYEKGSILAPHVDRLPLVSSAIIHVAHGNSEGDEARNDQEEEPWILEVIGHDGKARNITMEDDDMLLYESHSIIHGRPFPLQGSYYANIFVHFEPYGHSARHASMNGYGSAMKKEEETKSAYKAALKRDQEKQKRQHERKKKRQSGHKPAQAAKNTPGPALPPYIHPSEAVKWNQEYYFERDPKVRKIRVSFV